MHSTRPRTTWKVGLLATATAAVALATTPANAVVGESVKDSTYTFTAKLDIGNGERSCSGSLVDSQWVITAGSCFADDPATGFKIAAGAPKLKTTATIGRTDLTGQSGQVSDVVELVPRADRDLVMARLAEPVPNVSPLALGYTAPAKGETLEVTGYGRTKDQWVPDRLHAAAFQVDSVADTSIGITGKSPDGAGICKGDTGGPAFRKTDGGLELVAVNSRSWQGGCFASAETRRGAVNTRVDDINPWIQQVLARPQEQLTASADFNGDGKDDLVMLHNYGRSKDGRNEAGLWLLDGTENGFKAPRTVWDSGTDSWNWNASKLTTGDFNGDGKTDLAVLYDYGRTDDGKRNHTGLWIFSGTGNGFKAPQKVWDSGKDSWNWNASQLAAGDFDGDGKTDLAVLYDYGRTDDGKRNHTGLWIFSGTGNGLKAPQKVWDSGKDSWNWNASKLTTGDFDGDGKTDLAVLYDYGQTGNGRNQSALWVFSSTGDGFKAPRKVWDSASDSWNWNASKLTTGDFNGDGKTDLAVLYDYGRTDDGKRNHTGLWIFSSTGDGFKAPRKVWDSASDSWNWNASKLTTGDFNGDGKTDLAVLYDYGVGTDGRRTTAAWTFSSTGEQFTAPRKVWSNAL
ncbi:FG-GAP-like repeat-containing protein [Streptomyces sp. NPDC001793]|uniref:FG-GAP-like repeat-containing protein n=1 Tax=Streptomyces sp. NPDC001793 TaxID=3154657 RepID=UPI00332DCBFD